MGELEKVQQDKAAAEAMAKAAGANAIAQEELAALQRAKRKALEQKIESRRQEAAAERHRQAQMEHDTLIQEFAKLGMTGEQLSAQGLRLVKLAEEVIGQLQQVMS